MSNLKESWENYQKEQAIKKKRKIGIIVSSIVIIIGLVGIFGIHQVRSNDVAKQQHLVYVEKNKELIKERERVLALARKMNGVSKEEYFTYEDVQMANLNRWREENQVSNFDFDLLVDQVGRNAESLRESFFLQPSFDDNSINKYDYETYKGND